MGFKVLKMEKKKKKKLYLIALNNRCNFATTGLWGLKMQLPILTEKWATDKISFSYYLCLNRASDCWFNFHTVYDLKLLTFITGKITYATGKWKTLCIWGSLFSNMAGAKVSKRSCITLMAIKWQKLSKRTSWPVYSLLITIFMSLPHASPDNGRATQSNGILQKLHTFIMS